METLIPSPIAKPAEKADPLCPVFGSCGGCSYQDISYAGELGLKEQNLRRLFAEQLPLAESAFQPIVPSPASYYYRNRLDLTLARSKGGIRIGFQSYSSKRFISVDSCAIARPEISDFIPQLKVEAISKLPENYRRANLVVRTGDDSRVAWGGIGRRSLVLKEEDYLWTEVSGRKIFYSLDTFFQANLSILPLLIDRIRSLARFGNDTFFWDLYSGVGLFGICFADQAGRVVMIEEGVESAKLAHFNVKYHKFENVEILPGKVEEMLPGRFPDAKAKRSIAFVDPPRSGLSPKALAVLADQKNFEQFFYLSCQPESLLRDLRIFCEHGWKIKQIIPFDFFPRTRHLEVLALLEP